MLTESRPTTTLPNADASKPLTIGYATQDRSPSNLEMLGGAGYYRCAVPALALAQAGHDVRIGLATGVRGGPIGIIPAADADIPSERERMRKLWVPDILVLQRYMNADMPDAIHAARVAGQTIINDVDDLMWNVPVTNAAWRATHPATHPDANINHYKKVLAASTMVTCSTPFLAEQVRVFCRDAEVVVLRNALDLARWATHEHSEPPRLGWTGVLTYRSNDIEQIGLALETMVGNGYAKQFRHVGALDFEGAPHIHDITGLKAEQVAEYPMCPIDEWPSQLRHFDVGVVPLSDVKFNRAKSCIKGLEYAAAGIPFVASATPEYLALHAEHGIGRLAPRGRFWIANLRELADPAVRQREAARQREAVAAFDITNRWPEWEDSYRYAAG